MVAPLEITDLLWSFTPEGDRLPVQRSTAAAVLEHHGQHRAARLVRRLPASGDVLDPAAVDHLGLRVHRELQRLAEELQFARRVAATLRPWIAALRGDARRVTVVDVGCGIGHLVRTFAATGLLGPQVDLVGADLNPVLVDEAVRLARVEDLDCRFVTADVFTPGAVVADPGTTIVVSSGMLHHIPAPDLPALFAATSRLGVPAFAHWDIAPCAWSTIGAWVFHRARMREPVARHDGVLSARRAHPATTLLAAAAAGAPTYAVEVREGPRWYPRALDVLRPVVGEQR